MKLRYKLELISDSMDELIKELEETVNSLKTDPSFVKRIKSKKMESVWFTEHSTITSYDPEKATDEDDNEEESA